MKKILKHLAIIFSSILAIALVGYGIYWSMGLQTISDQHLDLDQRNSNYQFSTTPTLFLHGWAGDSRTFNQTIDAMQSYHVAEKTLTVYVDFHDHLHFNGKWDNRAINPMIQVIFYKNLPLKYDS